MSERCEQVRESLLAFGWTAAERGAAAAAMDHLESCEECRRVAGEYEALRGAMTERRSLEHPAGGWEAFEGRLQQTARRPRARFRWPLGIAAGLLLAVTALNGWMLLQRTSEPQVSVRTTPEPSAMVASDMTPSSVFSAFRTVSDAFDGRADWVMLSNRSSEMGLVADRPAGKDVLLLRVVVTHGKGAASQMHFAIVPGATVRVSVPSDGGERFEYVITTDAANLQNVAVSMAVGASAKEQDQAGLGSMATSLHMKYGEATEAGSVMTERGKFDLSMTLDRSPGNGA